MINRTAALLALGLVLAFSPAFAHEGNAHAAKTGPVKKEQTAWGIAGDIREVRRTIAITMTDAMRFTPDSIQVKQGEVVKFVVRNSGGLMHEIVIGTRAELDKHAALMAKHPGMEHDSPYMAHVAAGKTGELIWKFNRADEFGFACLIAGHFQSGMVGTIKVVAP